MKVLPLWVQLGTKAREKLDYMPRNPGGSWSPGLTQDRPGPSLIGRSIHGRHGQQVARAGRAQKFVATGAKARSTITGFMLLV